MPPRVFAIMSWLSASIELPSSRCHDPCRRSAATAFKHHRGVVRGPSLVALVVAGRASARAPGRTAAPPCLTGSVHAAKKSRRLGSGPVVDLVVAGRAGAKLRRRARLGPSRCASLDPSSFSSSPRKQAHRGAAVRPIEPLRRMGWPAPSRPRRALLHVPLRLSVALAALYSLSILAPPLSPLSPLSPSPPYSPCLRRLVVRAALGGREVISYLAR